MKLEHTKKWKQQEKSPPLFPPPTARLFVNVFHDLQDQNPV